MKHHDPAMDEPMPGAAEVKQAYSELPSLDVPSALDARILARARKATNKSNKVVSMQLAGIRRWAIPLSTAASVIVVLSVVYETQFKSPRDLPVAALEKTQSDTASPAEHVAENAAPSTGEAARKSMGAGSKQANNAARGKLIQPAQPTIGPAAAPIVMPPPVTVSMAEPTPAAPAIASPPSSPAARSEQMVMANASMADERVNERGEDKKEQESKAADRAQAGAKVTTSSAMGMAAKPIDASTALAALSTLAGHYNYQSYRIVLLSGEVVGLKELGYAAATLDIDAQGTLTRRMTATNGKVTTQTAKVIEAKFDGRHGEWTVLWSDMSYPVQSNFGFAAGKLVSRTQFEDLSDTARFGSAEQATLQR
jgi:hypothetical protein